MGINDLIRRAEQLSQMGKEVLASKYLFQGTIEAVDASLFSGFRSACLSFFKLCFSSEHPYYREFDGNVRTQYPMDVEKGLGILEAARKEMEGGWLVSTKGLVSAEIFADFLEMAEHLIEEGYKDAAAVMIGSVLEEHLRQLCQKHGIDTEIVKNTNPIPKKADLLNGDLAKAQVYTKLDQKNVTAWLGLRNNAAHGKYGDYNREQVKLMLQGVSEFISRISV
jgi:hypothetical protein